MPLLLDDGEHRFIYGPSSTPLAQVDGSGETEYLGTDLLGTPRLITDEDGDVGATATYDAFGALTSHIGAAVTRFGFTGNWTDPDTGLLYLRARDYDAATGQFLTVDPALDRTQQPYAYTGNNPVQRTDPTGLDWWTEAGENVAAAGAGALSNLTMGASDAILGAMVPGYDCFIADHSDAYGIGDMMVTIVSVALIIVPGVGIAAAGLLIAKTAIREAIKTGLRQTVRAAVSRTAAAVTRTVTRTATHAANEGATLYRGLNASHVKYSDALDGVARPGNPLGHADGAAHNAGDTFGSSLTSWTTDFRVAESFMRGKPGDPSQGVILTTTLAAQTSRVVTTPDYFNEAEVLLSGVIEGLSVARRTW